MRTPEIKEKYLKKRKINNSFFMRSLTLTLIALVFLIFMLGLCVYTFVPKGKILTKITDFVPFPVASVDGHFIFFSDFLKVKDALKRADSVFASKGLISEEAKEKNLQDIDKNVLRGLVRNKKIEILLREKGASVIKNEVDTETEKVLAQLEKTDLIKEKIKELYGWDTELYKEYVIKSEMERLKLEKVASGNLGDKSFEDWLINEMAGANVRIFLRGYEWDKENLSVVKK